MRLFNEFQTLLAATAALTLFGCDPGPETEARGGKEGLEVAATSTGGDTGGDSGGDGEDEWEADSGKGEDGDEEVPFEFAEPVPQVCEEKQKLEWAKQQQGTRELWSADEEEQLASTWTCARTGTGTATYLGYSCSTDAYGNSILRCDYQCDCEVTYESPCNPPHADCGKPFVWKKKDFKDLVALLGDWQCQLLGPIKCPVYTQDIADNCAALCVLKAPVRTRECPECEDPKKE